jgi:hypothetical protein
LLALFGRGWSGSQYPFWGGERTSRRRTYTARPRIQRARPTDATVSYAKDAYENSGDTFRDGSQAVAKKVQENPLGSMLIAGGIGFALAL